MAVTGAPWPEIRSPLRDGWQAPEPDGVRKSTMDDGTAKRRKTSAALGAIEAFVFKLPPAEADLLRAHFRDNSALRFLFPHPIWGEVEACYEGAVVWSEKGLFRFANVRLEIFS